MRNFAQPWVVRKLVYAVCMLVGAVLVGMGVVSAETVEAVVGNVEGFITPLILTAVSGMAWARTSAASDAGVVDSVVEAATRGVVAEVESMAAEVRGAVDRLNESLAQPSGDQVLPVYPFESTAGEME